MPPAERTLLHDVHVGAGGVFGERLGRPVVTSYGDADGEYTSALDGAGLVDLAERGVLEASGPKRLDFLQGMLSNDVAGRQPGQGCRAAMMTAKGQLRFLLRVLVEKEAVRLETDADQLEALQRSLEHYRLAAPVRFETRPTSVLALLGLKAADTLQAQGVDPPSSPEEHVRGRLAGQEVALTGAGALPVGRDALDARRVEDLRPWYGADVTEENLLHETGLLNELHSPTKGCYVGQEVVARLEARGGNVNKALRRLRLSAPAPPGTSVHAGERDVGRLATTAESPRFGPVALAWVHRSHFAPGTRLEVDGAPATVVNAFDQE